MKFEIIPTSLLNFSNNRYPDICLEYLASSLATEDKALYWVFRPFYNQTTMVLAARNDYGGTGIFTAHAEIYGMNI